MQTDQERVDPDDLDFLEDFLLGDAVSDEAMMLSELDGFLTAITIGPELILPSEWLPQIWRGEEPEFADTEEARRVMTAIMGRYNEILTTLAQAPLELEPILDYEMDGTVFPDIWASGFLTGVQLREAAWEPIHASAHAPAFGLITALAVPARMQELMSDPDEIARIASALAEELPIMIGAIDAFWKKRRGHGPTAVRRPAKTGRNEPCPCGSGRKYKKCCGAN